jgi:hypothetical protein
MLKTPDQTPNPSLDDPCFSTDVCIIDEHGLNGLAYYDFHERKWKFHTDIMEDYFEDGNPTKWWWYYPVVVIEDGLPVVKL